MYKQIFKLQADIYKAMASEKRLEIIQLLNNQELTVSQMQAMLGLTQPNLSQHLQILREHRLVITKRQGQKVFYRLSHKDIIKALELIREMVIDQNQGNDRMTEELRLKMKDLVPIAKDPVCQMRVSPKTAVGVAEYKDKTYYFCASGCKKKFEKEPKKYV